MQQKYIAFLRAINVGRHQAIKMENLAKIFSSFELLHVKTFLASGNVVFETETKDLVSLTKNITTHLEKTLGYNVPILLRTTDQLQNIVKQNPYNEIQKEVENLNVVLLERNLSKDEKKQIELLTDAREKYKALDREIISVAPKNNAPIRPRFSNNFIEKQLGCAATTRTFNTIQKLAQM